MPATEDEDQKNLQLMTSGMLRVSQPTVVSFKTFRVITVESWLLVFFQHNVRYVSYSFLHSASF